MSTFVAAAGKRAVGGGFLIEDARPKDIFTPEDFTDEQRQIAQTTAEFAENSVLPRVSEIEAKDFAVTRELLREAGELGLLAVDVPEQYGGLALGKVTSALIADRVAVSGSFSVSISAHTGIGTLPLVWYGTSEQKEKYLSKLATGEWIAAYALSESSSGSDAMNIRTRAKLSPDGKHYILDGEKMWTSNAGFADFFTIFAKIDGEKFSAFLVEATTPGLSVGKEEHKLGIRGSSTCPLLLANCMVGVENLLGEAGKGHHIAFNILNVGRYKLGAATIGAARSCLRNGLRYGKDRIAFGKPIVSFGLVQEKIAECAAGIFAAESLVYRVVGAIDAALADVDPGAEDFSRQVQKRIEEYAVECSIVKVWCSEMLGRVTDQVLQIYGGYGYTEDYPAERSYRDARINRIFEGTNEINRLIVTGWMLKRAMQGSLALLPAIQRVMDEVMAGPVPRAEGSGPLAEQKALLAAAKKLGLFAAGAASEKYAADLVNQQEVAGALADIIMEVLVMESAILRAEKMQARQESAIRLAQYATARGFGIVENAAERVLGAVAEGDMLRTRMAIFRRLAKHEPANTIALGRQIAEETVKAGRYLFSRKPEIIKLPNANHMSAITPTAVAASEDSSPSLFTSGTAIVLYVAFVRIVLYFFAGPHYGYFRDELYYLACGEHPAWGYVDQPPLIGWVAWLLEHTSATSLWALRLVPALAGTATIVLAGRLARELGGRRWAIFLASLAALMAPILLTMSHLFTMNALDPVLWTAIAYLVVRIGESGDERLWLAVGALAGVTILNKYAVLFWLSGLIAGLALTPLRQSLRHRWFWFACLLATVIALPNFLWQWRHQFPFLQLMHNIRAGSRDIALSPLPFLGAQAQMLGFVAALLVLFALLFFFSKQGRSSRALGWAYLIFLSEMMFLKGKMYYLTPVYPMMFAAGAVWLESATKRGLWGWVKPALALAMTAVSGLYLPTALPVLSVPHFLAYEHKMGIQQQKFEHTQPGVLPQIYADMFGWEGVAQRVAGFYHTLSPEEQRKTAIFANNYGDAGAIDFFGPKYGLPKAIAGHQTYWIWGPHQYTSGNLIVLGEGHERNMQTKCASYSIVGNTKDPLSRPEEWKPIYYCRGFKWNLQTIWPQFKHWD